MIGAMPRPTWVAYHSHASVFHGSPVLPKVRTAERS
jgi:hypothetical protein